MGQRLLSWMRPEDWKRAIALVILWAYAYQLVVWPMLFHLTNLVNYALGLTLPAPPLLPWEHLLTGTTTLGMVGGIQAWRDGSTTQYTQTTTQQTQVTQPKDTQP
jgi:hypothetical protein